VRLANGSQCEEIIEGQRAKRAHHAQRGQRNAMRAISVSAVRMIPVSTPSGCDQVRDRKTDDEKTRSDP
jgi:hypothetical protein